MPEPEELIADAARHATVFARDLWRRHRPRSDAAAALTLADVSPRLDLLVTAVFGTGYPIRTAQPPPPPTLLSYVFQHRRGPVLRQAVPATDDATLWLPAEIPVSDGMLAVEHYRIMALQQAMRARRGSASLIAGLNPLPADVYLLLEAYAADEALAALLPGLTASINALRKRALAARPPPAAFPEIRQPLERFARSLLAAECGRPAIRVAESPAQSLLQTRHLIKQHALLPDGKSERLLGPEPLLKDCWTGRLHPIPAADNARLIETGIPSNEQVAVRSARLKRRPEVRQAKEQEDDDSRHPGPWMIQTDEPHLHAEDPMGMQRPVDRDEDTDAGEFGDLLSELPAARLAAVPGLPKEVLLSDDPPDAGARQVWQDPTYGCTGIRYPEWDYRARAYRDSGTTVRLLSSQPGLRQWVDATLAEHRAMLETIRRRFETLRARRMKLRKQLDGEEIDLEACIDGYADLRAGDRMNEALYQTLRRADRDMAVTLLIDVSGSTDGWISANRRVIDVEREALLLVCIALESMGEPFSVLAFSGDGPQAVNVRQIKRFEESYGDEAALRIAALEPERYTRTGAAIRHAAAQLMRQPASHRLLLLLSDGKPNDIDDYEGRYGVEDTRQAVIESRLQGIFPFCLTIDRQAANYLPRIFGAHQYALLPKPELLPAALLDWMKRLTRN